MKRKMYWLFAFLTLFTVFSAGNVLAGWQEDQAAMFQQAQLKPGEKIDKANWEKIKDVVPPSVAEWVKKGDFILDIAEFKWDYNTDEAWRKATADNAGKYEIGPDDEVIEKATGKLPEYLVGEPFPTIDWKNDPKAGIKLVHNIVAKGSRTGTLSTDYDVDWIGRQGFERDYSATWYLNYFWNRPSGPIANPENFVVNEFIKVRTPYDLSGMVQLTQRFIDSRPDQSYAYLPAIRRTKKVSGSNRSSPFLGTDFVNDDAYGFYGKPESMNWKIVGEQVALLPVVKWGTEGPANFKKQQNGGWAKPANLRGPLNGYEVEGWTGAPWAPTNFAWVPRKMYVVECVAKDKYYNYGKMRFYIDPVAGFTYKVIHDRAGDYWKTLIVSYVPAKWDNRITVCSGTWYGIIDDKTDHASICNCFGEHDKYDFQVVYRDPEVTSAMMAPTAMAAQSK